MKSGTYMAGSFLLEAMIALLLFSFGILGLIGLQAAAITTNVDTGYRVQANNFAQRMLGTLQGNLNRQTTAQYQAGLVSFDHLSTGDACTFSGTASTNPLVTAWLADLSAATGLPQAAGQIRVTTGTTNQVRVVVCWKQPGLPIPRRHVVMGAVT
jgi:type IV pilus assembly protein PilV